MVEPCKLCAHVGSVAAPIILVILLLQESCQCGSGQGGGLFCFRGGGGGVQRLPSVPALVTSNCSSSILHQSCQIDLVQQLLRLPVQQQIPAGCKVIGAEKLPQKCGGYGGYGQIVYRHAQLRSLTEGFL